MDTERGCIVWMTGLPSGGKTTLATMLEAQLVALGRRVERLDGDELRTHLTKGLGFSRQDRDENVRRVGWVARLLARHGVIAVTALISPYRSARDEVRRGTEDFIEVWVKASVEECMRRDVKGLYKKALAGEIPEFTGISDPYEPPLHAEVVVETDRQTAEESVAAILGVLAARGYVGEHVASHVKGRSDG
jgi:adenylyl-sulfate kinase